MRQGTTPTITAKIKGVDVTKLENYELYLKDSSDNLIIYGKDRIDLDEDNNAFEVELTQEETFSLEVGYVKVQARLKYLGGPVVATKEVTRKMDELLSKEIMQ